MVGRPLKYREILAQLDDDKLYAPKMIATRAWISGQIGSDRERQRLLSSLGSLIKRHGFPEKGDGMVRPAGQQPQPGWFGWRFKDVLKKKDEQDKAQSLKKEKKPRRLPPGLSPKWKAVFDALDDETAYSGAAIARLAVESKLIEPEQRENLRLSLNQFIKKSDFPTEGDALVRLPGQSLVPGWFGWRFKKEIKTDLSESS